MYAITAVVTDSTGVCHQLPTFFLDENVQGIVSEDHARRIAALVIRNPAAYITAVRL